ncbi:MAG: hypothetical protein SCH98_15175 [Deferrisomatales bacterium]|nr:hypothetical protein [Deferrisomatales bacterium]
MPQDIRIALNIPDKSVARQIGSDLARMPGLQVVGNSTNGSAPPGPADVVILQDVPEQGDVLERMGNVRNQLPAAAIFVVSPEQRPEHIVEVMKAGAVEYFLEPVSAERLQQAVEKVRESLAGVLGTAQGKVYSFVSAKGGLGATVIAVNAATALAVRGEGTVALIDNTLHAGDSGVLLDLVPQTTIGDLCRHFNRLDFAFLRGAMVKHSTGLHFLGAPAEPEEGERVHGHHVGKILEVAKSLYDHVIVDCKSMQVDEGSVEAFHASDRIFVVTDLSVPGVRNASRLVQLIQRLKIPPRRIEVVANRYIKGGVPSVSEIEKTLGRRLFWLFPNDFGDVIHSINQGVPLVQGKPGSLFGRSIREFVERLAAQSEAKSGYRGVKGFLGRAV